MDPGTTGFYTYSPTLSLPDALPIYRHHQHRPGAGRYRRPRRYLRAAAGCREMDPVPRDAARQAGAADRPGDAEPRILAAVTGRGCPAPRTSTEPAAEPGLDRRSRISGE